MRGSRKTILHLAICFFLVLLVADASMIGPSIISQQVSAVPREFEENITVPTDQFMALDLLFTQGDELELIFEVEVKEDLPIDIWFVDYANYVRLVDLHEFLYFIDGSGQELKQTAKVVTITQHGTYELVFANYNNVTVEVNLKYDINVYPEEETTSDGSDKEASIPLWREFYVMLPLGLVIGIVGGFIVAGIVRKPKKDKAKHKDEKAPKKTKKPKVKKKVSKKPKTVEATEEPEVPEKAPQPSFCGHCGKPVETSFCPFCGKEVNKG